MATRKRKGNQMWKSQIYQPHCISWGLSISLHVPLYPRYMLTWTVYSYMASRCCGVRSNRTMSMGSEASVLLSVLIWDGGGAMSLGGCRWSVGRGRVRVIEQWIIVNWKGERGYWRSPWCYPGGGTTVTTDKLAIDRGIKHKKQKLGIKLEMLAKESMWE